jgi:hypothetical protein
MRFVIAELFRYVVSMMRVKSVREVHTAIERSLVSVARCHDDLRRVLTFAT